MSYLVTIDLDWDYRRTGRAVSWEDALRILFKIVRCRHCRRAVLKASPLKGYHIILYCDIDCDLCRLLYDDERRYEMESRQPWRRRNVLFDKVKIKFRGGER